MKYWIRWIIAAVVIILLFIRLIYTRITRMEEERAWFLSQLHYKFSARVDSVLWSGRALVEITQGDFDRYREWELQQKLKAHKKLEVMVSRYGKWDLRIPYAARKDDSVYVDSDKDILSLYRKDSLIVTRPFSVSLRDQPF